MRREREEWEIHKGFVIPDTERIRNPNLLRSKHKPAILRMEEIY